MIAKTEPRTIPSQDVFHTTQGYSARQRPRTPANPFKYAATSASNAAHSVAAADAAIRALNGR